MDVLPFLHKRSRRLDSEFVGPLAESIVGEFGEELNVNVELILGQNLTAHVLLAFDLRGDVV